MKKKSSPVERAYEQACEYMDTAKLAVNLEEKTDFYRQAIKIFETIVYDKSTKACLKGNAYENMGLIAYQQGGFIRALHMFEEAVKKYSSGGINGIRCKIYIGKSYFRMNKISQAMMHYDDALAIMEAYNMQNSKLYSEVKLLISEGNKNYEQ